MTYISIAIVIVLVQILAFVFAYCLWRMVKDIDKCWEKLYEVEDNLTSAAKQMQTCLDTISSMLNKHSSEINITAEELKKHQKTIDYLLKNE